LNIPHDGDFVKDYCPQMGLGGNMELMKEILEEVALAAQDIDYGKITISISGPPSNSVDIITEKRYRYRAQKPEPSESPIKEHPQDKF
jgi:hypothetical protein